MVLKKDTTSLENNITKIPEENEINNNVDEETSTREVDYDELLSSAGELGRYQVLLFLLTCPFYTFGVFMYFSQLFLTVSSPNHWCWIPELSNLTALERRTLAIPLDKDSQFGYSRCSSYVANWTEVMLTGTRPDENWSTTSCQHGWEFNKSEVPYPTISSELEWVCEKDSYQAIAQSMFFVGSIVGGFVVGWVADRFGRLQAVVFSNMIGCITGIATTFVTSFTQFTICRFIMGMSYDNCMIMAYLILLEYVAPKYRTVMANMSFAIFFTIAVTALPWIAKACGDWKVLSLATSVPLALVLLAFFILPESPRWLLSKGRVDDAINKVKTIARVNKKEVPVKLIEQFKLSVQKNKTNDTGNLIDLMKRPKLRLITLLACLEFFSCTIVYDSLVRTIDQLGFDFFVSFTVISATEFPSLLILSLTMDFIGRRWLTIISMLTCALFCFITPIVGDGLPAVITSVIARFAVNMSFNGIVQWVAEMLPTPVRGSGTSFVHICGYIATVLSPFVAYLDHVAYWLPMILVGTISIIAAAISLALPETAQRCMPQTFDDAEELIRNQSIKDIICLRKRPKISNGQVNTSFVMN